MSATAASRVASKAAAAAAASSSSSAAALKWAAGGWTFFIVENVVLSENRSWLIDQLGDDGYHGVYGTLSTLAMTSVGYAYFKKLPSLSPPNFQVTPPRMGLSAICTSMGLIMASQAFPKLQIPVEYTTASSLNTTNASASASVGPLPTNTTTTSTGGSWKVRCPFDFTDSKMQQDGYDNADVWGLERISRHPGLWSFAFLTAGQAALATSVGYQVWWTMPSLVALVGGSHTDSRYRRNLGGTMDPTYDEQTSNIPFLALFMGKQGNPFQVLSNFITKELKPLNAILATMVATTFVLGRGKRINATTARVLAKQRVQQQQTKITSTSTGGNATSTGGGAASSA